MNFNEKLQHLRASRKLSQEEPAAWTSPVRP